MKQYKKNYELKNTAKDKLDGKYGKSMLLFLLSSLISGMTTLCVNSVAATTMNSVFYRSGSVAAANIVSLAFDLILVFANIICAVMNAGIALYFLSMACNRPCSVGSLFYGFKNESRKTLTIAAALILCQVVCLWPCQYCLQFALSTSDSELKKRLLLSALAAIVVGLCIYIPVSLGIAMSFYLMFDFPENSGKETLALCWRIMKGHRLRLFSLQLSFLPLMLLCILSFGIGFLWLDPYMELTYAYFFLDLMNPAQVPCGAAES